MDGSSLEGCSELGLTELGSSLEGCSSLVGSTELGSWDGSTWLVVSLGSSLDGDSELDVSLHADTEIIAA